MIDGECITEVCQVIPSNPLPDTTVLPIAASKLHDCCGLSSFKVFGDTVDTNPFKNDVITITKWFNSFVSAAVMKLLKWDGSTYTVVKDLVDNSYGTYRQLGFFVNDAGESFVGYDIDWRKILADVDLGEGSYKVRVDITTQIGGTGSFTSDEYCLSAYSADKANGTVKIEYYLNGIMGINEADLLIRDYGDLNRYNSFRVRGWFGMPKSKYIKDYTRYNNGQRQWVKDEQEQEFELQIKIASAKVHELMRTDVIQADKILITDYNKNNAQQWIQKSVQCTSDYAPEWIPLRTALSPAKITFRSAINNLKKFRN